MTESYIISFFYAIAGLVCWYRLHHHPAQTKVKLNNFNYSLNFDQSIKTQFDKERNESTDIDLSDSEYLKESEISLSPQT
jgi:hypothetical protein